MDLEIQGITIDGQAFFTEAEQKLKDLDEIIGSARLQMTGQDRFRKVCYNLERAEGYIQQAIVQVARGGNLL